MALDGGSLDWGRGRPAAALPQPRGAERLLQCLNPAVYGASRNHRDGAVTRLFNHIRHGVLTLAEVRDAVFQQHVLNRDPAGNNLSWPWVTSRSSDGHAPP